MFDVNVVVVDEDDDDDDDNDDAGGLDGMILLLYSGRNIIYLAYSERLIVLTPMPTFNLL
jgi:hypothetical protein